MHYGRLTKQARSRSGSAASSGFREAGYRWPVEQAGHLFDGLWAAIWTMLVGEFDLIDNLCWRWDTELGPGEPRGDDWPTEPAALPAYFGCGGVLAVSRGAIEAWSAAFTGRNPADTQVRQDAWCRLNSRVCSQGSS
jgi:hypothetical protein